MHTTRHDIETWGCDDWHGPPTPSAAWWWSMQLGMAHGAGTNSAGTIAGTMTWRDDGDATYVPWAVDRACVGARKREAHRWKARNALFALRCSRWRWRPSSFGEEGTRRILLASELLSEL